MNANVLVMIGVLIASHDFLVAASDRCDERLAGGFCHEDFSIFAIQQSTQPQQTTSLVLLHKRHNR